MSSSGFELADAVETEAKRSTWTESLVLARTEDRCELPRCLRSGKSSCMRHARRLPSLTRHSARHMSEIFCFPSAQVLLGKLWCDLKELTTNRMQRTNEESLDASSENQGKGGINGAQPVEQVHTLRWKRGIELPPFVSSNDDALALCAAIASGTVELLPDVIVSDAVALQIVRLVMSGSAVGGGWNIVYVILATLKAGRLMPVDHARVVALRQMLTRKYRGNGSTSGAGLQIQLQRLLDLRHRSADICSMTLEQATEHTLKKWDLIQLAFDFGGGGGDPGGGGAGSGA